MGVAARWLLCIVVFAVTSPQVFADDLYPPPWRGEPGTTWQIWEFGNAELNPLPDDGVNPYDFSRIAITPADGTGWNSEGWWSLGQIVVPINNVPKPNLEKLIWIQLTWQPQGQDDTPIIEETEWPDSQPTLQYVGDKTPPDAGWLHSTYLLTLPHNPPHEIVRIAGNINVSELVIDTKCVPEPATIWMLATAGLGLVVGVWRRRRK